MPGILHLKYEQSSSVWNHDRANTGNEQTYVTTFTIGSSGAQFFYVLTEPVHRMSSVGKLGNSSKSIIFIYFIYFL